ncbi:uncharacterized protein LOC129926168 [Biomphalaria glabrata]|uniref:Uncharacterized protein LOC129926168 n=1 Tax=Biomphalaria glabrata TaxID=6526 RepID=A0A9W3AAY1_BIOGL|nr:uncharacterized protein LOC129926168 [Biomphalaria glabrata]
MTVMKDTGTQTDVAMDIPYPVQASSPLHSGYSCEYNSDCYEPSIRNSIDTSFNISMPYDAPHPPNEIALQHERKYMVFKSALEKLFTSCSSCGCVVKAIFLENGTCVNISQLCSECGYHREWSSQPKIHQTPVGNLLLSAATLFTGCLVGQTMQFLDALNLARISESTFFKHQKDYLHATVENVFSKEQQDIINHVKIANLNLNLAGDGRSDSPGHSAKYGAYSVLECQINKVLDIQIVQSTEVANSNACELEGLKRSLCFLEENGLIIKSLTTDRHTSVSKFIRTEKNYIRHFYDIWHVAKGLKKKLDHISLKQGGELVNSWKKSIINHLYWCAVSTADGNGDLMLAKWQSILNHLVNQHTGHPNLLFPSCLHGSEYNTENKDWFEPGTDDYESVCKILDHCKLEKDIKKLSPIHQTAALESFHSLVIKFAPKHTAFSYLGMRSR